jgi:putative protease
MKTPRRNPPELLAPAGSRECFHVAIEAGADAVYLGLDGFNARLRAKNFTIRDLSALVPYAHSRGVKVYVTLNTLIKQNEIATALNILYQLDQTGADAVIMADIGLMRLSANNFPNLRIHGSTQAAAHNSYGAEFLKSLGVKRAVLARELSLEEIEKTAAASPIETEVFIHGALCYSISGMCLASSFIGGASGNRGRCTQVCRRRFKMTGKVRDCIVDTGGINANGSIAPSGIDTIDGYFFSPNDLQALPYIDRLAKAGVACFKIEGRMKGAEYVSTAVRAYRRVIDFPNDTDYAESALRLDFGRAKTVYFMDGKRGKAIDPDRPSGTGIFLGTVVECDRESFSIDSIDINTDDTLTIEKNDRLRIHPKDGFEGIACRVSDCQVSGDDGCRIKITPSQPVKCATGDSVFFIGRVGISTGIDDCHCERSEAIRRINTNISNNSTPVSVKPTCYFPARRIADSLTPPCPQFADTDGTVNQNPSTKPVLWFKADNIEWLDFIIATPCQRLIFDADISEIETLIDTPGAVKTWRSRIFVALPPFIEEPKLALWRDIIKRCRAVGLNSFAVSNAGHFRLVNKADRIVSDAPLWCLNRFTQKELHARGVDRFVFSWEDEYLNIRDTACNANGVAQLYGRPPLFISRLKPALGVSETAVDPDGNVFFISAKNGLYYTLPTTPVCLFAKRKKLSECGVNDFLIDVSFHEPDFELAGTLVRGFKECVRVGGGTVFNFKAGLK